MPGGSGRHPLCRARLQGKQRQYKGITAAKGLAALTNDCDASPMCANGGEGARRPTGWWRDSSRAPWPSRRSALPRQRQVSPRHDGGEGSRRPTGWWRDSSRAPWPSMLGPPAATASFPTGITAAKGLAALTNDFDSFPQASRRRRVSPPYQMISTPSHRHDGGEGSRRPTIMALFLTGDDVADGGISPAHCPPEDPHCPNPICKFRNQ